jgi:oligosaccharide repeat unit polymerase
VLPLLFFVGFIWYMKSLSSVFGLSTVIAHPSLVRASQGDADFITTFSLPGRLLYSLGPLVFVAYACPWLIELRITKIRRAMILIATTAAMALSLGRTYLLVAFIWMIACFFIGRPEIVMKFRKRLTARQTALRRRMVIVIAIVLAVAAFQLFAAILGKTASNVTLVQQYTSGPLVNSSFTAAYIYVTGGIPAFASEVSHTPQVEGPADPTGKVGWSSLYPAVKLVPGWKVAPLVRPFDPIPFPFNAYTWFDPLYRDFGVPGVIVGPFVFGAIVALLVVRTRRTAEGALFAGLMLSLTVFAPFLSKINDPAISDVSLALLVLWIWPRSQPQRPQLTKVSVLNAGVPLHQATSTAARSTIVLNAQNE